MPAQLHINKMICLINKKKLVLVIRPINLAALYLRKIGYKQLSA